MIEIDYILKFKSDFHFGSGSGIPGIIDCGLKYNTNGVPEINGKTVKGIIRDSVENIIYLNQLFVSPNINEEKIVEKIFGKQGEDITMFRFSTPLLKEKYEKRISENSQLQKSIGITEFHNRIKRDTLVAKQGALFSREVGPEVFEYAGKISQIRACSSEQKLDRYLSFLICGMRFVTHIGGNRRRGKGLARLEIEKVYDKNNEKIIDYRSLIKKGLSE